MLKKIALALFLLCCVALPAFAQDKESAFERVIRTGTIRCGYALWYPELSKDPNTGALSGYDYDVVNAIGDILGLTVEWTEETGWGTVQEGLKSKRYDMACNGYWGPPSRTKVVLLSRPFVFHPLYVVVGKHVKVPQQKGFDWLNDKTYKMAILRGTIGDLVAKMNFPNAQTLDAAELSSDGNVLMDIASGKADFSFSNYTPVERFLAQNTGGVKRLEPSIGVAGGTLLLPADDFRMKHMVDSALAYLIDSGRIGIIMQKYMGNDKRAWLSPALSYQQ